MRIINSRLEELVLLILDNLFFENDNLVDINRVIKDILILLNDENVFILNEADINLLKEKINEDIDMVLKNDPASKSRLEVKLCYPGVFASTIYRFAHILYEQNINCLPRMLTEYAHSKTGIDINPGANIGRGLFIDHGTGIVVGETAYIGNFVKLYHGVTIGAKNVDGFLDKYKKRHPTILDNVTVYANATILGGNTIIGNNAIIGCNTIITKSVKDGSIISNL